MIAGWFARRRARERRRLNLEAILATYDLICVEHDLPGRALVRHWSADGTFREYWTENPVWVIGNRLSRQDADAIHSDRIAWKYRHRNRSSESV